MALLSLCDDLLTIAIQTVLLVPYLGEVRYQIRPLLIQVWTKLCTNSQCAGVQSSGEELRVPVDLVTVSADGWR